jgi:L,D-transpeptidase catalytic domain
MKLKLISIAIACTIGSSGCSTSQAQPTTESPSIVNNVTPTPVVAVSPPVDAERSSTEISKSSVESTSEYQCSGTNNYLFLGNGTVRNKYGNPLYLLHLCVGGKERRSFEIVTGRNFTQLKNRNQSGTHSPLPNGKYRMSNSLTQGMVAEVGRVDGLSVRQPFLPISPMFSTGRSALGIHVDPSFNRDPKEDGTSGCIGLTNPADFKALWASIQHYQIKELQVAINTRRSDNPDIADR